MVVRRGRGPDRRRRRPFALSGQLGASTLAEDDDPAWIQGLSGSALQFNGHSGVRLANDDRLNSRLVTAEVVVRLPQSPGAWRYIVSSGGRDCIAGAYGLYSGAAAGIAFYVFDGSGYVVSPVVSPEDIWDGAWHHVAGTFDGSAVRLYLDGRPVGSPIRAAVEIDYGSTSSRTYVGRYAGECDLGFAGDLDHVRLWSRALDANAVITAATGSGVMASGAPLAPVVPGTALPAQPNSGVSATRPRPHSCRLRLSRPQVALSRATLRVLVSRSGKPWRTVRVIAQRFGRRSVLSSARTNRSGRARLRVRVRGSARLRVSARGERGCAPAYVRVYTRT